MNNKRLPGASVALMLAVLPFASCRKGEFVLPSTSIEVGGGDSGGDIKGFFLLRGEYGQQQGLARLLLLRNGHRPCQDLYAERNPAWCTNSATSATDIQIYGNKLYAVINCSNLVEVMDVATARHEATVYIPNCRYIVFQDGYAYVSSYAGPVKIDPTARLGYVAR